MNLLRKPNRPLGSFLSDFFDSESLDKNFFDSRFTDHVPAVNVKNNDDSFVLEVASPGMEKEDFELSVDDHILSISAKHSSEEEEKEEGYTRKEFSYNSFERCFKLPESANEDKIKADYKNGVLFINIPKQALKEPNNSKKMIAIT